jgi:hypothetical protein
MGDLMKRSTGLGNGGFFIFEMIVGFGLLAVAAFVLIAATSRVHLASSRMADSRAAVRAAETALCQLQSGQILSPDPNAQVRIIPLEHPNENDAGQWVDVTATVGSQTRTLTGRVPRSVAQTAPAPGGTP